MVSKSFIAYACLFGFTTSINAQAAIVPGLGGEHVQRSPQTNHLARRAFASERSNFDCSPIDSVPVTSPLPSADFPEAVQYRAVKRLVDRAQVRAIQLLADRALASSERSILEPLLNHIQARLKVSSPEDSIPAAPPSQCGLPEVVGYRRLEPIFDFEPLPDYGASAPQPTQSNFPEAVQYRDIKPLAERALASSERSILEPLLNHIQARLKVTSPEDSIPAAPPSQDGFPNVVGYRDIKLLVDRALSSSGSSSIFKSFLDSLEDARAPPGGGVPDIPSAGPPAAPAGNIPAAAPPPALPAAPAGNVPAAAPPPAQPAAPAGNVPAAAPPLSPPAAPGGSQGRAAVVRAANANRRRANSERTCEFFCACSVV